MRMRWYLGPTLPDQKPTEEEEADPEVLYLAKRKANYSSKDWRKLIYRGGVFAPFEEPVAFSDRYTFGNRQAASEEVVLKALDRFAEVSVRTTDSRTSPDYLPRKMREMKLAQDFSPKELTDALNRMRLDGRVTDGPVGKFANRQVKFGLVRAPK